MYILRGLPASGKSTWRKESKLPYTNKDELRAIFPDMTERDIHEVQMRSIQFICASGTDIVIDNTNFNEKTVNEYKRIANEFGYSIQIKTFDVPVGECIYRDNLRRFNGDKYVGQSVIWKMAVDAGLTSDPIFHQRQAVIVDVDGTLADASHRIHYLKGKKDWKAFFDAMGDDALHTDIRRLVELFRFSGYTIILLSGRPEDYRRITENWLQKHNVRYDFLFMRKFNDKRQDSIIKPELYRSYVAPFFRVDYVLDDRNSVVQAWRNLGLRVLQVADGDF
jgi:predicted kinase/uncharacterized HAD superfamily protein